MNGIFADRRRRAPERSRGFTLVELLVVIVIFAFLTALLVTKYGNFNQSTLLSNLAYDVALSVRQAQTYGISVRTSTGLGSYFNASYGVAFRSSGSDSCGGNILDNDHFLLFVNTSSANFYTCSDAVENSYTLKQGARVSGLCARTSSSSQCASVSRLDVTFHRPDPDATICVNGNSCLSGGVSYFSADVTVTSADGNNSRTVTIGRNGQISVALQ